MPRAAGYDARQDKSIPEPIRRYLPKDGRVYAFAFILYPVDWCHECEPDEGMPSSVVAWETDEASAPADYLDIIRGLGFPCVLSPLHDKDVDDKGKPKKPHIHGLGRASQKKHIRTIRELLKPLGCPYPQPVSDVATYARYLCHLDNEEKARYQPSDVVEINGGDYMGWIGRQGDKYKVIGDMMDWVNETGCESMRQLMDHARAEEPDWFRALCSGSQVVMLRYMRSIEYERLHATSPCPF